MVSLGTVRKISFAIYQIRLFVPSPCLTYLVLQLQRKCRMTCQRVIRKKSIIVMKDWCHICPRHTGPWVWNLSCLLEFVDARIRWYHSVGISSTIKENNGLECLRCTVVLWNECYWLQILLVQVSAIPVQNTNSRPMCCHRCIENQA